MNNQIKDEIKNNLSAILEKYFFSHNDEDVRYAIVDDVCKYLNRLCETKTIYDFHCICDESNNDESVVQSNNINCKVGLKFSEGSNFILLDMTTEQQHATFEDIMS